ncbi:MAG: Na+/H+ antiporter NhaA [Acidobacteriota bacterium]
MSVSARAKILTPFEAFFRSESRSGFLLIFAALAAFLFANWEFLEPASNYERWKQVQITVEIGDFANVSKGLLLWINDGLMVLFFLFVGLEIKREMVFGELKDRSAAAFPVAAAIGGMVFPALVYVGFNAGGEGAAGWGVPMATDIAFALGMLALLGPRVPVALKVFLTALAIVDDLGAIAVIAIFYTETVKVSYLAIALLAWVVALLYGRRFSNLGVFAILGVILWYGFLKSGVHATVAGVLLAFAVPIRHFGSGTRLRQQLEEALAESEFERQEARFERLESAVNDAQSPLHRLEHGLKPWVAYLVMPVFAFFNAGFALEGGLTALMAPVAIGSALGLLIGKTVGITFCAWLAVRLGWARLPDSFGWSAVVGASMLAGIGFTMSLFIGSLAFGEGPLLDQAKLGVLSASVIAAIAGLMVLRRALPEPGSASQ